MSKRFRTLIVIISVIMLLIVPACRGYHVSSITRDYRTIELGRGIAKFSFSYAIRYDMRNVDINAEYTDVSLKGPPTDKWGNFTTMSVHVLKPEKSGLQEEMEELLATDRQQPDFSIVERHSVTIAGETGDEVVFYYTRHPLMEQQIQGVPPVPATVRRVMFLHGGLLWWLELGGLESTAAADGTDFDRTVQTFKILD